MSQIAIPSRRFLHPIVLAALAVLVVSTSACRGDARHAAEDAGADSAPGADSSSVVDSAAGAVPDTAGDTTLAADSTDPFAGFRLDAPAGASESSARIGLLLRNDAPTDAVVYADGGAGEVLLDTVPAESSVRIDVMTRARTILLRSATPSGSALRSTEVGAGPDSVVEVDVGRGPDSM